MMKRQHKKWRKDVALVALSFAIGAAAFSFHRAHACQKRGGNELGEEFELEVMESSVEGEPRIALQVEVGDRDILYKKRRKGTRISLSRASLQFERVSK